MFYTSGQVPEGKDPCKTDEKLISLYDIRKTDGQRYRAKKRGDANIQYIRFERDWLMLATAGNHLWRELERKNIRDCRRQPIQFQGYSISLKQGLYRPVRCRRNRDDSTERDDKMRVRVLIARNAFRELKADFNQLARKRRADWIAAKFFNVPFEPYAPIRRQLLQLLNGVNQIRKESGLSKISSDVIRFRRKIVKPFEA